MKPFYKVAPTGWHGFPELMHKYILDMLLNKLYLKHIDTPTGLRQETVTIQQHDIRHTALKNPSGFISKPLLRPQDCIAKLIAWPRNSFGKNENVYEGEYSSAISSASATQSDASMSAFF